MNSFVYNEDELPEVVKDDSSAYVGAYYNVGSWSMSDLPSEDGSLEVAYNNALAWIAWYNFLKKRSLDNVSDSDV